MCPVLDPNDIFHKRDGPLVYNVDGNSIYVYRKANTNDIVFYLG